MDDREFLQNKAAREIPPLPDALSRAAMERQLAEQAAQPKKKTKSRLLRLGLPAAAVAVAAAVALLVTPLSPLRWRQAPPVVQTVDGQVLAAADYQALADRLVELKRKNVGTGERWGLLDGLVRVFRASGINEGAIMADGAEPETVISKNAAAYGADHSETNRREDTVDEADIIKTDGDCLYLLPANGGTVSIVRAQGADMTLLCTLEPDKTDNPVADRFTGIFLTDGKLVVTGSSYEAGEDKAFMRCFTTVAIYDLADKAAPRKLHEYRFPGAAQATRLVGDKLLAVTFDGLRLAHFQPEDPESFVPGYRCDGKACYVAPDDIYLPTESEPDCYVSVFTLSVNGDGQTPEAVTLLRESPQVYCTDETLYLYYQGYYTSGRGGSFIDLQSLDIRGDKAVPLAEGRVDGMLGDSFAIDAFEGNLRLAITQETLQNDAYRVECRVKVLDAQLREIGDSGVIAADEYVRGVRFMGRTAYVVTFRQTDPLFVLDMSDPAAPTVKGQVKLPGFSTYLHPVGDGLLLGLGYGGTEEGLDGSAKLSLFDVSDPTAPQELDKLEYQNAWLDTDYKAFVDLRDGSYLCPLTQTTVRDQVNYTYHYDLVRVSVENGKLRPAGRYAVLTAPEGSEIYSRSLRGAFIGNTVYALSEYTRDELQTTLDDGTLVKQDYQVKQHIDLVAFDRNSGDKSGELTLFDGVEEDDGGWYYGGLIAR